MRTFPYRTDRLESQSMKPLLLLAAALLFSGCADVHDAERTAVAGRGVTVERLFENDGVIVYRFIDAGRYHYYAVPRSGMRASMFSEWSETCGKNCTKVVTDEIPTVALR